MRKGSCWRRRSWQDRAAGFVILSVIALRRKTKGRTPGSVEADNSPFLSFVRSFVHRENSRAWIGSAGLQGRPGKMRECPHYSPFAIRVYIKYARPAKCAIFSIQHVRDRHYDPRPASSILLYINYFSIAKRKYFLRFCVIRIKHGVCETGIRNISVYIFGSRDCTIYIPTSMWS